MDKIIPRSIHYADLKPECIEHQVRLVKFLPQNSNAQWIPGNPIPIKLQGNGFYDPYSAYLNIKFQFNVVGEFAYDSPTEPFFTQCRAVFTTNNTVKQNLSVITDDYVKIEPALEYEVNGNDHARAFRTTSLKFVQLISIDDISTQLGCYNTYARPRPGCEFKMLDRSAHSLINQVTIRSQSTEVERIDEYDVLAAMINDTIYSNEQAQLHAYEGFGGSLLNPRYKNTISSLVKDMLPFSASGPRGRVGEVIFGWAYVANEQCDEMHYTYDISNQGKLDTYLQQKSKYFTITNFNNGIGLDGIATDNIMFSATHCWTPALVDNSFTFTISADFLYSYIFLQSTTLGDNRFEDVRFSESWVVGVGRGAGRNATHTNLYEQLSYATGFDHSNPMYSAQKRILSFASLNKFRKGAYHYTEFGTQAAEFVIPIYSGLIGVLMPDKKLLPLSLLPLDLEFRLNPFAVIVGASNTFGSRLTRQYTVTKFELHAHMIFFEQEVHRALENVVAEHGIFFHIKSFYKAPDRNHSTTIVNETIPIDVHFKSINSVHFVFLYSHYRQFASGRKLHFVSHNLTSMQLRNGTDMIPNEPITLDVTSGFPLTTRNADRTISSGRQSKMFIENMKSWNRMHDPTTDAALEPGICWMLDQYASTTTNLLRDFEFDLAKNDTRTIEDYQFTDVNLNGKTYADDSALAIGGLNTSPNAIQFLFYNGLVISDTNALLKLRTFGYAIHANPGDHTGTDYTNFALAGFSIGVLTKMKVLSVADTCYDLQYTSIKDYWFHKLFGQFGLNPKKIPWRPAVFFNTTQQPRMISPALYNAAQQDALFPSWYVFGLTAESLTEKIQAFQALTGRCQYSIGLEGINLGSDLGILSGKKGMTPFDLNVKSRGKDDPVDSISVVFCKYDAVVYVRSDLVVQVLGK